MWLAAIACAQAPLEVSVGALARAGGFGTITAAADAHSSRVNFGVHLRATGHLRPWVVYRMEAVRVTHDLWFGRSDRPQRWSNSHVAVGPSWKGVAARLRVGAGWEGLPIGNGGEDFTVRPSLFGGAELGVTRPVGTARLSADLGTVWGVGRLAAADLDLAFPGHARHAVVVFGGTRLSNGSLVHLEQPVHVSRNHSWYAGLGTRLRVRPRRP